MERWEHIASMTTLFLCEDTTITAILSANDVMYSQTGAVLYCAENLAEFAHSVTLNVRSKY